MKIRLINLTDDKIEISDLIKLEGEYLINISGKDIIFLTRVSDNWENGKILLFHRAEFLMDLDLVFLYNKNTIFIGQFFRFNLTI